TLGNFINQLARDSSAANRAAHRETGGRSAHDQLRLAVTVRRARPHRCAHRRAPSRDGGKAIMSRKEVLRPGNAGCQSAAFGRCAECTLAGNTTLTAI